ncbi:DUF3105 domain-containing protein [Solirubrobacter ginsenosidimutans]|uniref:DUF3105 domain-containing protein n=1 Tax=Solirubrobacter ginsenosidimutans TaxID=490573 RepID=A0A9X3MT38_9ACTN|nr:DUF3105 domain-containing protein [Solirubrobacter ginsenosidimutans]MDA0161907.1 DUF3105 domain-containing protein [Solirubrobacter ginsenosidimutans]
MSSRQEEKERRKRERQEREAAEQAGAARRKRMQLVFGGVLGSVAVIAVVLVLVFVVGNSSSDDPAASVPKGSAAIPAQQISDIKKAAAAAGCTLKDAPNEGAGHIEKEFKPSDYKQNPPTSGNHFPEWYQDGIYNPGDTPELGKLVHTLEHGRIDVQYAPGTPATTVAQLETFFKENEDGYHMLLFQNGTKMPFAVAATAWDHQLGCKTMNPKVFDALRTFRETYIDKGPEVVP